MNSAGTSLLPSCSCACRLTITRSASPRASSTQRTMAATSLALGDVRTCGWLADLNLRSPSGNSAGSASGKAKPDLDLLLAIGLEAELVGDLAQHRELLLGDFVQRLDMQRVEPRASRKVGPLRARLVAPGEGRAAGDHRHGAGGRGVIAGPACILEIAADAGEGKPARLQRLDRVHKARDRIVERMVGGGGEEVEARRDQLIQHPGGRAEMRAAALQRGIAAIIVGQALEIGEGDVGCAYLVEQRLELGVVTAVQPALQDRIAGEKEGKGHARQCAGAQLPESNPSKARAAAAAPSRCPSR